MKKPVLFLYTLLLETIFVSKTFALNYFSYTPANNLATNGQEIKIDFDYDLQGYEDKDFIVRPVLSEGIVEIYNQDSDVWVNQADLWTNMPQLQKTMNVKLDISGSSDLYFQIQNTKDAKIYETPKHTIWGDNSYSNYLDKLNKNIKMYVLRQESPTKEHTKTDTVIQDQQKTAGLFAKVIKYIGEII